jgi:hypothetical protein
MALRRRNGWIRSAPNRPSAAEVALGGGPRAAGHRTSSLPTSIRRRDQARVTASFASIKISSGCRGIALMTSQPRASRLRSGAHGAPSSASTSRCRRLCTFSIAIGGRVPPDSAAPYPLPLLDPCYPLCSGLIVTNDNGGAQVHVYELDRSLEYGVSRPGRPAVARPGRGDLLARVAPLGWEHIGLTGDYVWTAPDPAVPFRPLRDIRAAFPPLAA